MTGFSVPTELILSSEAPGEGVGLGVGRVDGGAPDVDGGGVRCGSHVSVMSLCRRKLHGGGILQFLG